MPFVEREDGAIVGVYANFQLGYAEEELAEDDSELLNFLNPPAPPYTIDKLTVVERLTDNEAELVYPAMASMPAKLRFVWDTASVIRSDSPFFDDLKGFLAQVLSPNRATDLLSAAN